MRNWVRAAFVLAVGTVAAGCLLTPGLAPFDQTAYQNAVSVKFETLALVDKAGGKYSVFKADADALTGRIESASGYAAGIPNNQLATQAWQVVRDPQGSSAAGFMRFWREKGQLPPAFRNNAKRQMTQQFDYIICLETNKQAQTACPPPVGS